MLQISEYRKKYSESVETDSDMKKTKTTAAEYGTFLDNKLN